MKLNTTLFLLTSISLIACSSPESIQTKMSRYKTHFENKYQNSELVVLGEKFNSTKGRTIASISNEKNEESAEKSPEFTNKKLYFLGLLDQYEFLRTYVKDSKAPPIALCPSFHTGVISYYEKNKPTESTQKTYKNYSYDLLNDENYLNKNPELYLSLSIEDKKPNVLDYIKDKKITNPEKINEVVTTALNGHLTKTFYELREMCEYGQSDNYYIYENMITHFKTSHSKNINTLLKTTVFTNLALVNSLKAESNGPKRTIASEKSNLGNTFSEQLVLKMNADWAKDYFKSF